jgi:transposase
VHVRPEGTAFGCATDPEGLGALVARLQPLSPCLIVLEASGGYEGVVAAALAEAGLPVAMSIRARCANLPGLLGDWPRPMRSTRR